MAMKCNVVKTCWQVITKDRKSREKKHYLLWAESQEAARLNVPDDEEVLSVLPMDGSDWS